MEEIWKDVENYEGHYQVSNTGLYRSVKGGRIKILSPGITKSRNGYPSIQFYKDRIRKMDLLHRVVFRTFNGEIPPDMEVDHINGIRTDCRLSNLRLLTPKQNCIERTLRNNRSSKYLYVSYNKEKKKWSCQITVDKVQFRVGYYETEDEAGYVSEQIQNGIYPPELLARIEAKKKTNTNG